MSKTENPPPPSLSLIASTSKDVASELLPFLQVYKDGTVKRFLDPSLVPPILDDLSSGVSSKDIVISTYVSARLFLPKILTDNLKLPILVYYHGGGFCIGSAFSSLYHLHMNSLASQAKVLIVSVEYRLAPEYPLPAAYEDSWDALNWVASHFRREGFGEEPWLVKHGDFDQVYIGGDSAGANIVHNIAMRAGTDSLHGDMKILGAFLCHPFFWGSKPIGSEPKFDHECAMSHRTWKLVFPHAINGLDNPMINPFASDAPSLVGLKCRKLLICVASLDELRERGVEYCKNVKESGWGGEIEFYVDKGESHCFHILNPQSEGAKKMIKRLVCFLV